MELKYGTWKISSYEPADARALCAAGFSPITAALLCSRGYRDAGAAREFLSCSYPLSSPFALLDMDKAAARVKQALSRREHIAVFGDYDVDGITATCLLTEYLRSKGGHVTSYIPARLEEGYGLNPIAIDTLKKQGVELIVTVDCGITANHEAALCRELGIDLVITDHHECKSELPQAIALVDPHRKDQPQPVTEMAGVGVAFKLAAAIEGEQETLLDQYCDFLCLGTVADVMPLTGENRTMVARGLKALENPRRVGIAALMAECSVQKGPITAGTIGYTLAPRINAAGRMGEVGIATELFLTHDAGRAVELAGALCRLNRRRQEIESSIYQSAVAMLPPGGPPQAIVLADESWHQGVVGIVASRLSEKYSRPSFMIHLNGSTGKGSCRSWGGFNLFAALENCKDLLLGFGGHELAAGFTIDRSNIPAFRDRMNEYARSYCGGQQPESALEIDVAIAHPAAVTLEELEALSVLEPYGSGNARPLFCLLGATLLRTQNVGQNRHLKLRLGKGCAQFDGIFFSTVAERCGCHPGDRVDAAFYLQINEFRGSRTVQLQMVDIRPSLCASGREQEALTLAHRCAAGKAVSLREARRALPTREQFAAAWRFLDRTVPEDGLTTDRLPLLRLMAAELGGAEPVLRAAMCAAVFRERGLLDWQLNGDAITLHLRRGQHVALDQSPLMNTLQNDNEKGGGAL